MTTTTTPGTLPGTALATVSAVYEAFGRGDVPTLLGLLAEDAVFDDDALPTSTQRAGHPLFVARRGHEEISGFFAELGQYRMEHFRVVDLVADEHTVVAFIDIRTTSPAGGTMQDDAIHVWRVNADGLVTSIRHYVDTAKHLATWKGESTD